MAEVHWQPVRDRQIVFATCNEDPRPRCVLNLSERIHLGRLGHVRKSIRRETGR